MEEKLICCICGKEIKGHGNNPFPVKEEGWCCDECNKKVVEERLWKYFEQLD